MDVCCVLSGRGPCDELITRPHRSPTDCGATLRVITKPRKRGSQSRALGCRARDDDDDDNNNNNNNIIIITTPLVSHCHNFTSNLTFPIKVLQVV
jgi:hypothetical protein